MQLSSRNQMVEASIYLGVRTISFSPSWSHIAFWYSEEPAVSKKVTCLGVYCNPPILVESLYLRTCDFLLETKWY